tara:strand:+ start:1573 stop:2034 length:462 start_codon:yes stop_codon:yes gene_type:complete
MKYYIPEINLRDIRNKNNVIKKFEDVYNKEIIIEKIIISIDGFYKIEKEEAIKYKFIEKEYNYQSNFLNNYSLIGIDCYEKKIGEVFSIPSESQSINIEKIKFNIGKSDNYIVFEKRNNKIIDIYFLSKKKIDEHNIFFNNDVSSFINLLMSN